MENTIKDDPPFCPDGNTWELGHELFLEPMDHYSVYEHWIQRCDCKEYKTAPRVSRVEHGGAPTLAKSMIAEFRRQEKENELAECIEAASEDKEGMSSSEVLACYIAQASDEKLDPRTEKYLRRHCICRYGWQGCEAPLHHPPSGLARSGVAASLAGASRTSEGSESDNNEPTSTYMFGSKYWLRDGPKPEWERSHDGDDVYMYGRLPCGEIPCGEGAWCETKTGRK